MVCEWPALGMPWATARSNAPCALVSRSGGACTGGCGSAVQVVCEASSFVTFWSPSVMEAVLGIYYCTQSPASVWVASPGHAVGHCKVKCTLSSVQQVWWSLHRGLLCSATTAHRGPPVCEWPALGMPWATARSNAPCAVVSRSGGACTGGCGSAVQVVRGGCSFAGLWWIFPEEEAALGNHSAQSPASV